VSAPAIAAPARTRTATGSKAFAAVAVISLALVLTLVAVAAWSLRPSDDAIVVGNHYGIGYPLHGGLAGPSRVSVFEGLAFPHGGFAGPSRAAADR